MTVQLPLRMRYMTPLEEALADRLQQCQGRARALTAELLARELDVSDRLLRQTIEALVEVYGLPIGSSVGSPPGYYWITTAEEIEATCRNLRARAMACLVREARLRKMHLEELLGQLRLGVDHGPIGPSRLRG